MKGVPGGSHYYFAIASNIVELLMKVDKEFELSSCISLHIIIDGTYLFSRALRTSFGSSYGEFTVLSRVTLCNCTILWREKPEDLNFMANFFRQA
jgi:hypothetical protein